MWAFLEGGTFISARRARMALMGSITASMADSSAGKSSSGRYTGHWEVMMNFPSWGRAWKISSVMKGMKGWSSFKSSVST